MGFVITNPNYRSEELEKACKALNLLGEQLGLTHPETLQQSEYVDKLVINEMWGEKK